MATKKVQSLNKQAESGKITFDEYDKKLNAITKPLERPELQTGVEFTSLGRKYSKEYLKTYGNDINIGYLKDLGYDDTTAKEFAARILRANRKTIYGL